MSGHSDDVRLALDWARFYRALGYQPLPSRTDIKGPMLGSFADYWDKPLPASAYDEPNWWTPNIQLMTGQRWKLAVVDCDGPEAARVWREMAAHHGGHEPTWEAISGGGGLHVYFSLDGLAACPSRLLWGVWDYWAGTDRSKPGSPMRGKWTPHTEIRLLGDRKLVIAPPSLHVDTGKPYQFSDAKEPRSIDRPAPAPAWLLGLPEIEPPGRHAPPPRPPANVPPKGSGARSGRSYTRDEVLASIPDKIALAASWGLRLAARGAGRAGWWKCYSVDGENRPSAGIDEVSGVYIDHRDGSTMSLFDLAVALDAYPTWLDAMRDLGDRYTRG